ncbi:MAG: hypothetical protein AAFO77_02375 [Pseudomonadota bacterium]
MAASKKKLSAEQQGIGAETSHNDKLGGSAIKQAIEAASIREDEHCKRRVDAETAFAQEASADLTSARIAQVTMQAVEPVADNKLALALEFGRKRTLTAETLKMADQAASSYGDMAQNLHALAEYMASAEGEVERLEKLEAEHAQLRANAEAVIRKYKALNERCDDQRHEIALLEASKKSLRALLQEAENALSVQTEERDAFRGELMRSQGEVTKYQDDIIDLREKLEKAQKACLAKADLAETLKTELSEKTEETARKGKEIALLNEKLKAANTRTAEAVAETKDVRSKYKLVSEQKSEIADQLEEQTFKLEASSEKYEEQVRLKAARIHALETELGVMTKQLSLAEDELSRVKNADFNFDDIDIEEQSKLRLVSDNSASASKIEAASAEAVAAE